MDGDFEIRADGRAAIGEEDDSLRYEDQPFG